MAARRADREDQIDTSKRPRVRTAVIVAAGKGDRLRAASDLPKPLVPVVGVPLIRRVMASAVKAGIERFVVVIGYEADRLRRGLPPLVPEGATLDLIENPRFEEPNGVSLLAAAERLDEPFALLMSDHLFSSDRLAEALAAFAKTGRSLLVVEPKDRFDGDPEDATRVAIRGGYVAAIGKTLAAHDAVDTGMFVLRAEELREALAQAGPAPSISDGMRVLAEKDALDALALETGFWQDVDTQADIAAAERKLYGSLTKPTDGFLARHVNRKISLFLSVRLWRLGVGPNTVTAATLLLGLLAGWAFAQGSSVGWGLLGAALFQLQSIVDGTDGELARLLHKESRFGFWFDVTADNLTHMAVFGGIALGQHADGNPGPWEALGIAAVLGVAASFAAMAPLLEAGGKRREDAQRPRGALKRMVDGLARRDFSYLLFPLALLRWLGGFLWAAAIGTWIYAGLVVFLRLRARTAAR